MQVAGFLRHNKFINTFLKVSKTFLQVSRLSVDDLKMKVRKKDKRIKHGNVDKLSSQQQISV